MPNENTNPAAGQPAEGARLVLTKTPAATTAAGTITVNVGPVGNCRKVVLEANKEWTVSEVLKAAGQNASGFEVRMGGEPVNMNARVHDSATILLLRPVTGNC